jgi:hypothetical protein
MDGILLDDAVARRRMNFVGGARDVSRRKFARMESAKFHGC